MSSGTLELSLDKEDTDIEFKEVEVPASKKMKPISQLLLDEYKSIKEKNDKIEEIIKNNMMSSKLKNAKNLGSGDQMNLEVKENFEEIEEKEIKNEKILKQNPNLLSIQKVNDFAKETKSSLQTETLNIINASDSSCLLDKNGNSETKAIQIICRTDDILTVLLDRKKETKTSESQTLSFGNSSKLKKKFSIFSSKKLAHSMADHEIRK